MLTCVVDAIVVEAEIFAKDESTGNGNFASPENAGSTRAVSVTHSTTPGQHNGKTHARGTGHRQFPFKGQHGQSDAGHTEHMEHMVAVVVRASSRRHQEDPATEKYESKPHDSRTRQLKTRPKSKRQLSKNQDRILSVSTAQSVGNNENESDANGMSNLSEGSDADYAASDDDSAKRSSKRYKPSRSAVTTSRQPQSRSRPRLARAVGDHLNIKRKPRSVRSVAVADRSASSACADHKRCVHSSPVVPPGTEQTSSSRLLSPEDISALVSAFAQKLLDLRRDSSTNTTRAADEVAVIVTESASEDERIGEPVRKRPRWTREDDAQLKDLKTRGWRWWEIKQQFPKRTKSALQQRWSTLSAGEHRP